MTTKKLTTSPKCVEIAACLRYRRCSVLHLVSHQRNVRHVSYRSQLFKTTTSRLRIEEPDPRTHVDDDDATSHLGLVCLGKRPEKQMVLVESLHEGSEEVDGEQRAQPAVCSSTETDTLTHVVGVGVVDVARVRLRGDGRVLGAVIEVGEKVHHALTVVTDVVVLPLAVLRIHNRSRGQEARMCTAAVDKTKRT